MFAMTYEYQIFIANVLW